MRRLSFPLALAAGLVAGPQAAHAQNVPCTPFSDFPLNILLGVPPLGIGGETVRCQNQKIMDAVNTLAAMRGAATGFATLDANGKVPASQIPPLTISLLDTVAVPSLTILGSKESGKGLVVDAPNALSTITAKYLTVAARSLFNSDAAGGPSNWLGNGAGGSATQYAYGGFAQGVFLSGLGDVGVVGATRTTDITTPGRLAIGTMGWAFNFNTAAPVPAWGGYFEARRKTGAGSAQSVEINVTELGSTDMVVPSAKGAGSNAAYAFTSAALTLASGGNCTAYAGKCYDGARLVTPVDASVAMTVYNNGAGFGKGIVLADNAFAGCDGTGGSHLCTAIEAGRGSMITFIDGSTRQGAQLYSDVSPAGNGLRLKFTDYGTQFDGYGYPTLNIVSKATDVNGIQVVGSATASDPARLIAAGSPNASLALTASGTGSVQIQAALQILLAGSGNRTLCVNAQNFVYAAASCQ